MLIKNEYLKKFCQPYTSNHFVCAIYIDNPVDNLELGHRGYFVSKL